MRTGVLALIALIALASGCAADSAATNNAVARLNSETKIFSRALPVDNKLVKRSLRQNDLDVLDSYKEERGIGLGQVDDVMEKVDDVISKGTKAAKGSAKLNALVTKNVEFSKFALAEKLAGAKAYKNVNLNKMSLSTLKQMDEIEKIRAVDLEKGIKGSKKTTDGMRRKDIKVSDPTKIAPQKYMESHVGRDMQRFGKDGSRWLSSTIVSRPTKDGGGQVLLISSSNPSKGDFLLPKGGWDKGEDVKKSALREVVEEGGVNAQLAHGLGKVKYSEGENKYTYFAFLAKGNTVYDDWSESIRYRLWVSYDEALELLANRPQMVELIKRAKAVDAKINAGTMPALDPKLSKVKID